MFAGLKWLENGQNLKCIRSRSDRGEGYSRVLLCRRAVSIFSSAIHEDLDDTERILGKQTEGDNRMHCIWREATPTVRRRISSILSTTILMVQNNDVHIAR